jgi:hypothetical protein
MPFFNRILKVLENVTSADICVKMAHFFCLQTQASTQLVKCKGLKKYSSIVIQELYSFKPKRTSFVNELSSTLVSFVTI